MLKLFDKSKLVKNLAQDTVLVPFLEREFERLDEPWEFKYEVKVRDQGWHPSGDCLPLASELYEKAKVDLTDQVDEFHSGSLRKSFMVGHFWHQWIQHIVLHKLEFCDAQAIERHKQYAWGSRKLHPPKPFHYVSGTADIAPLVTPRWNGLVDIKTMSGADFAKGKVPARFADKYKCQINIYMDLFDEDEAMILGVNKDSPHGFLEFRYARDRRLINVIMNKWQFVSDCLDNNIAPDEDQDNAYRLPL